MLLLSQIAAWIFANGTQLIVAVNAVLAALIALFLIIPGDQPEKALKQVAEFLAKFSAK